MTVATERTNKEYIISNPAACVCPYRLMPASCVGQARSEEHSGRELRALRRHLRIVFYKICGMEQKQSRIRQVEKEHMHSNKAPEINARNAAQRCMSVEKHRPGSDTFKEEVTVYRFDGDFLYIPNPLREGVRREMVHLVLSKLLYPPYRTSLDRALHLEEIDLFEAYRARKKSVLVRKKERAVAVVRFKKDPYAAESEAATKENENTLEIDPLSLIKKIRWSSLGIYYNWEVKAYQKETDMGIPEVIKNACLEISSKICGIEGFSPQTAIINYYQKKDRIMSHVDRYEEDMTKPLISFSLGASAVFVVGGRKPDDAARTFLLEDGDVVVLLNESRYFYHGVPKILEENRGEYDPLFEELIGSSRINISVRQIHKLCTVPE
jgi:DNA alkylation damage repair protein AlkB